MQIALKIFRRKAQELSNKEEGKLKRCMEKGLAV